jgi:signal transduction histidine kinase
VDADPTRLTQVFDNLLSNAVKYAPGSPVSITLKNSNDTCNIYVEDQGPGIAPQHLEHLFDRFYRVPDSSVTTHGTGLGLFICKEIIRAHGGDITVSSEVSMGTTFTINLPSKKEKREIQIVGKEVNP